MSDKLLKPGDIRLFGHYEVPGVVIEVGKSYGYKVIDHCGDVCVYHFDEVAKVARGLKPIIRQKFEEAFKLYQKRERLLVELRETEKSFDDVCRLIYGISE